MTTGWSASWWSVTCKRAEAATRNDGLRARCAWEPSLSKALGVLERSYGVAQLPHLQLSSPIRLNAGLARKSRAIARGTTIAHRGRRRSSSDKERES